MREEKNSKNVNKSYKQLTPLQHFRHRSGAYGFARDAMDITFPCLTKDENGYQLKFKEISVPPAVYQAFAEVAANVGDNIIRSVEAGVDVGDTIFRVDLENNIIEVENGGLGIPVEMHETGLYVPNLIFGRAFTSSHYDDDEDRHEIGQNGVGVKMTNVMSILFAIEIYDSVNHKHYTQIWENGTTIEHEPVIEDYNGKASKTIVSYSFDFDYMRDYEKYDDSILEIFRMHAFDIALTSNRKTIFNDEVFYFNNILDAAKVLIGNFDNYLIAYDWPKDAKIIRNPNETEVSEDGLPPKSEVLFVDCAKMGVCSYVNGLRTLENGKHVDHVNRSFGVQMAKWFNEHLKMEKLGEKDESNKDKYRFNAADVMSNIFTIVRCSLDKPRFNNQQKTMLLGPIPTIKLPGEIPNIKNWKLYEIMQEKKNMLARLALVKTDGGKKRNLFDQGKNRDAGLAASKRWMECVLFIVEGGSASKYAEAIIDHLPGRKDLFGVLRLRGKIPNAHNKQTVLINNKEYALIKQFLGLREGVDYNDLQNFETLRYGQVYIMTDADVDGSHIAGLLLNLFQEQFPSLLEIGYVNYWMSKILTVKKGAVLKKFYTLEEYREWRETIDNNEVSKWKHSYNKGLASNDEDEVPDDVKEKRLLAFAFDELSADKIAVCFYKEMIERRKKWMETGVVKKFVEKDEVSIDKFLDTRVLEYHLSNLIRSIPNFKDGLKKAQRKVLWGFMLKFMNNVSHKLKTDLSPIKIKTLTGHIMEKTQYAHGDLSLEQTMFAMIFDFVGTNNANLLTTNKLITSREMGPSDTAAGRYLNASVSKWIDKLYRGEDYPLYEFEEDDGDIVEPKTFFPIIPIHLVNGMNGIASGYSTFCPNHKMDDVIDYLISLLDRETPKPLVPFYRGFRGDIELKDNELVAVLPNEENEDDFNDLLIDQGDVKKQLTKAVVTSGKYELVGNNVRVTELPIGVWTSKYRELLLKWQKEHKISGFRDVSTKTDIGFEIKNPKFKVSTESLCLKRSFGMTNLVMVDDEGRPHRYQTIDDIILNFFNFRLKIYERRKSYQIDTLNVEIMDLTQKILFCSLVIDGTIKLVGEDKDTVLEKMAEYSFDKSYLKLPASSFTIQGIDKMQAQLDGKEEELEQLKNKDVREIWKEELEELKVAYNKHAYDRKRIEVKWNSKEKKTKTTKRTGRK